MNEDKIKVAVGVAATSAAVVLAVKSCIQVRREERAKRQQIDRDMHLDIQAINNATEVLNNRIDNGEIHNITQLVDSMRNEIAFQKIAIRED